MNRFLRLLLLISVGSLAAYSYKIWNADRFKDSLKCDHIELKQTELDISPIKLDGTKDIWIIKSGSKLTCFKLVFKNEGLRAFPRCAALLTVLCNTIPEGAGTYDGIALKKILEDHSIDLDISFNDDDIVVTCTCLEQYFDLAVDLVKDMLTKAHLKSDKIEFSKQGVVTSIRQNMFTPSYLAEEKLNNLMYAEEHPYRYSIKENLEKASAITKVDVDAAYKKIFNPKDLSVTIVSSLSQENIKSKFMNLVSNLAKTKSGGNFKDVKQKISLVQKRTHEHIELDNPQSTVLFAMPGILRNSPESYAAKIAVAALGTTGMISRLALAVRDKSGLVYGILANSVDLDMQACIRGLAATRPENVDAVVEKIKDVCKELRDKGITAEELKLFKTRLFAASIFDSNKSILDFVSSLRNQGIKVENINTYLDGVQKLKLEEVNAVIRRLFNPEDIIFVDCGKSLKKEDK